MAAIVDQMKMIRADLEGIKKAQKYKKRMEWVKLAISSLPGWAALIIAISQVVR